MSIALGYFIQKAVNTYPPAAPCRGRHAPARAPSPSHSPTSPSCFGSLPHLAILLAFIQLHFTTLLAFTSLLQPHLSPTSPYSPISPSFSPTSPSYLSASTKYSPSSRRPSQHLRSLPALY